MKYLLFAIRFLILGCKKISEKSPPSELPIQEPSTVVIEKPDLPEGAFKADFIGNQDSLYVFVRKVDTSTGTTLIGFENEQLPEIIIPESIGAQLHILKLKNFQNDVFVWKDSLWKQPVNRFDIHKSNVTDTLSPIMNDPKDSTRLVRYYSVFDMDRKSEKKYTWKLMSESISIED